MRAALLLLMSATAAGAGAGASAAPPEAKQARTIALFSELQEAAPFSADEMAARQKDTAPSNEGAAADLALNNWKICAIDALARWVPLHQGVGILIDGAFGRCADLARSYRAHLMRITQDGRILVDVSMARGMSRQLEEAWRPRLTALALDQELARQQPVAALVHP